MLEQAAGRKAVKDHTTSASRDALSTKGLKELQRRFGQALVLSAAWVHREDGFWVDVLVQPADDSKDLVCFSEGLDKFPSDEMIANVALVV